MSEAICESCGSAPVASSPLIVGEPMKLCEACCQYPDSYERFVAGKLARIPPTGLAAVPDLHESLFQFQKDLTRWALRRGRAAIFAATGLGKMRMEIEYARHVVTYAGDRVLILAPLAVASQISAEGHKMGIRVQVVREAGDIEADIVVTNYDRLHKFDPSDFAGVVMDESSCIKHKDSKTLAQLIEAFGQTPFRLCATATPSPNDYTELGTHAEFLGICKGTEMLAEFFVHDASNTQTWRLKGHARAAFWKWVASWGALVRSPSDLGYDDGDYALPPLHMKEHVLPADQETVRAAGLLFAAPAGDLSERRAARRASINARVTECAALVNADRERWVVWSTLNAESEALAKEIDGAIEVTGSMDLDDKESAIHAFIAGEARVLVSKSSIAGWGLNLQFCNHMAFVGVDDSWESHHQSIRRIWRFGQTKPCYVHMFASEVEGSVLENLRRKEADAIRMSEALSLETAAIVRAEVCGQDRTTVAYEPTQAMQLPEWLTTEDP